MHKIAYKAWYFLLHVPIYLKRGLVVFSKFLKIGLISGVNLFRYTLGLKIYRLKFNAQRVLGITNSPLKSQLLRILISRGSLQILLLVSILSIMIPQSHFFQVDAAQVPGRQTLLYKLLGPGEQDFSLEEISSETNTVVINNTDTWRQGAVIVQNNNTTGSITSNPSEISSLTSGGTAIAKPIIMPGATMPGTGNTGRTEIIIHLVQSGETIGAIAEKYGISVATILWANNLTTRSYIRPGDQLKILPVSGVVHKVKKGDNISKIAKLYGVESSALVKFNKLKEDGSDLSIGEEILVPGGSIAPPKPVYVAPVRKYTQLSNVAAPPPSVSAPAGSGYLWPAGVRYISQYFGWRHTGLDIAGKIGTPLYATKAGTVTRSQCGYNGGYGCYIIIDHGNGMSSLYGHSSQLYVSVGDEVSQGDTIALMGSTGRSTGSHLHFEIRINGVRQNPLKYIK